LDSISGYVAENRKKEKKKERGSCDKKITEHPLF
jgi:hypothetical protein